MKHNILLITADHMRNDALAVNAPWSPPWGPVQTFAPNPGSSARQPMLVMSNRDWLFPIYSGTRTYRMTLWIPWWRTVNHERP